MASYIPNSTEPVGSQHLQGDVDVFNSPGINGTGSMNIHDGNLYVKLLSHLDGGASVNTVTNDLRVFGAGNITANVGGSISLLAAAASNFTTSSGSLTVAASNSTDGIVDIIAAGGQNTDGSIRLRATNTTDGQVAISSEGQISQAILLKANGPSGGLLADVQGLLSLQTIDTTNGVIVGTVTPGVPVTLGSTTSTVLIPGNLVVEGQRTIQNTTTLKVEDNIIDVNSGRLTVGSDTGIMGRRVQTPQDTTAAPTGDVVNGRVMEFGVIGTGSNATSVVLGPTSSTTDNFYNDMWIKITSGANITVRRIKLFVGASRTATIYATADNDTETGFADGLDIVNVPASGDSYEIFTESYGASVNDPATNTHRLVSSANGSSFATLDNVTPQQFQALETGATTIQPIMLFNQRVLSNSGSSITVETSFAAPELVGTVVKVNANAGITPSITNQNYTVASVVNGTSITFDTGTTITNLTDAKVDMDLLGTSVLKVDYIQGLNLSNPVLNGFDIFNVTVTLPNDDNNATQNIPQIGASGSYALLIRAQNVGGCCAAFVITSNGTTKRNANQLSESAATDSQRVSVVWDNGVPPTIQHQKNQSAGNITYTITCVGGAS